MKYLSTSVFHIPLGDALSLSKMNVTLGRNNFKAKKRIPLGMRPNYH
ncbi:MAG: hypothetical protein FWH18_01080 [Marinilabiliaceae bacterium]|nr:hypothetical protein [Marinilabiliaceae bacterium]